MNYFVFCDAWEDGACSRCGVKRSDLVLCPTGPVVRDRDVDQDCRFCENGQQHTHAIKFKLVVGPSRVHTRKPQTSPQAQEGQGKGENIMTKQVNIRCNGLGATFYELEDGSITLGSYTGGLPSNWPRTIESFDKLARYYNEIARSLRLLQGPHHLSSYPETGEVLLSEGY